MQNVGLLAELKDRLVREATVVHDYIQIVFVDGTVLNLFNPVSLNGVRVELKEEPGGARLRSIVGRAVQSVSRTPTHITLTLNSGDAIAVSVEENDWVGPEALALFRPGQPPMVITER